MLNFKKNKRGIEAAGFSIIIGLVILLLSGGIIIAVIKNSAGRADEKVQVDLCRISNEIRLGIKERTPDFNPVSSPRICTTIDKTEDKFQVPTKRYPQDVTGAKAEIRDMIKNCWYMWLEGSEVNAFGGLNLIGSEGCVVCYKYKVKERIKDKISFEDLSASMSQPFFAVSEEEICTPSGGFFADNCGEDIEDSTGLEGWKEVPSKEAESIGKKCCVRNSFPNECENKGGRCYEEEDSRESGYDSVYLKWSCPTRNKICYVTDGSISSYTSYIQRSTVRGGDVFFIDPNYDNPDLKPDVGGVNYASDETFAISFISPNRQWCNDVGDCFAGAGKLMLGAGVGGGLVIASVLIAGGPVTLIGGGILLGGAFLLDKFTPIDVFGSFFNWGTKPIARDVPSLVVVSSFDHAREEFRCSVI